MADATTYLSNKMTATAPALGEVIQRAGALAMSCGLAETQVAALGAAFLSSGASPEIASTALSKFVGVLSRAEGMSGRAEKALASLGFSSVQLAKDMQTDAKGTIFAVMEKLAGMPKDMQVGLLTQIFGEESIKAIAPLLANMGNLEQAFALVADKTAFAGSMQAEFEARSKTTSNALQLMRNRFGNLSISVGTIFLPAIAWAAEKSGSLADALRSVVDSPFGQWLLPVVGGLSAAVIGLTAFSAAMWAATKTGPLLSKSLAPAKAAILGLGWPVLTVIAAVALLYAAYRNNFGGIADVIDRWYKNIRLVVNGVIAVFKSLIGTTGEIRGELAKEIKAAGLEGFVTTVSKVVYRVKKFFQGVREAFDFSPAIAALTPAILKLRSVFDALSAVFARLFGSEVTSATDSFTSFGQVVGYIATGALAAIATAINLAASALSVVADLINLIAALFRGDWAAACGAAKSIWDTLVAAFMSIADLFKIGDWLRAAWNDATTYLESINLYECGARILETLKEGIFSAAAKVKDSVVGVFQSIRDLLPFSDAKEGPLSQLTLSGSRIMTTLAEGATQGAGQLKKAIRDNLGGIGGSISEWGANVIAPPIPSDPGAKALAASAPQEPGRDGEGRGTPTYNISIGYISLPNVKEGKDFMRDLLDDIAALGGGVAPA
jgi:hypothetical protein